MPKAAAPFAESPWDHDFRQYQFRYRWYDPHQCRFTSLDPLGYAGGIEQYAYCAWNPVNLVDPLGLGASAAGGSEGARLGLSGLALGDLGSGAHAYGMALGFAYECDIKKAAIYGFQGVTGMIGGGSGMRDLGTLDDLARGAKRLWWDEWGQVPVPGAIRGFTWHGYDQMMRRNGGIGVSYRAMIDAVKRPLSIVDGPNGTIKYVGMDAVVVLNSEGKVVTTWARNSRGHRIAR